MRVAVLSLTSDWGGAEVHTAALARTLAARGHAVTILELGPPVYRRAAFPAEAAIAVRSLRLPAPVATLGLRDWRRLLRGLEADLCLCPKGTLDTGSWRLDLAARRAFPRFVTVEHLTGDPMPPRSRRAHLGGLVPGIGLWWFRLLARRCLRGLGPHRVVCVSEAVRRRLVEAYRFPPRKLTTVHNGIDPERYRPAPEARRAFRAAHGIPFEAVVFGCVGRLSVQKAYHLAVAAFARVPAGPADPDTRLVLVGEGRLRAELARQAQEAGLGDRVRILDFTDRPWEACAAFDCFVLPSLNEGLPLALLEAMACGCCPIATRVGGVPEILPGDTLGWVVPPGDAAALREAMRQAAALPADDRRTLAARARERVVTHFNAQTQYARLAELLEREAAQAAGTAPRAGAGLGRPAGGARGCAAPPGPAGHRAEAPPLAGAGRRR
jgi:glycosyltransferase involved in cell wall biosynthesis